MKNIIDIKNLTKSYGKSRGIINLNLTVEKGDFFGFMGPNGAGKSTTIRTILGLIKPNNGSIHMFNNEMHNHKVELLEKIGYMPSEAMFYNNLRVNDIIKFSSDIHKKDCSTYALELCNRLEVDTTKKIDELSLGNRKKVSIVCAMQHKPDLFVLDEPTSGLDPLMQNEFFKLLMERNREGATIFLSSHVLSEIQRYCDKVAIIREGCIITVDTVSNLSSTNAKKIRLKGVSVLPSISGISGVETSSLFTTFMFNGNIHDLINYLPQTGYEDLLIEEPSLDEIFMHYYEKEDTQNIL